MAISLSKGQNISLEKQGNPLTHFCVGVNWGMIVKKGWFSSGKEAVDLDASVGLFNEQKQLVDKVYFGHKRSNCGSIQHSGDDLTGDDSDDGQDNEVIVVDLNRLPANVQQVVFVLNSFRGQDFKDIPYARIRLFEGKPDRIQQVVASLDIANDAQFAGSVSMIMGKLYRHQGSWKFKAIGEATSDRHLEQTLDTVARSFL